MLFVFSYGEFDFGHNVIVYFCKSAEGGETQCEEVARIYTGMPVYTGILAKSPVFRPYFCDFTRIFVILCRLNALLCCLE